MRTVTVHAFTLIGFAMMLAIGSSCEHENPVKEYYPLPTGDLAYRTEYFFIDPDTKERNVYNIDTINVAYLKDTTVQSVNYSMLGHYGDNNDLVDVRLIRKVSDTYFERASWFDPYYKKIHDLGVESLFLDQRALIGSVFSSDEGSEYTVVERNLTMDVNGVKYTDVIRVSQRPTCCDFTADRYYAPNVGLILAKLPYPISLRYSDAEWSLLPR